jgi:hypothetical protein
MYYSFTFSKASLVKVSLLVQRSSLGSMAPLGNCKTENLQFQIQIQILKD